MSEVNYNDFTRDYDEVEPSHGLVNEPLAKGRYWLTVAKIEAKDTSKGGVPRVRVRLRAKDLTTGEPKGTPAFVEFYIGAGRDKYENGEKVGLKTDEEYQKSVRGATGRVKGFMQSIGVGKGAAGEGLEGVFSLYNVDAWEGREFVGDISVRNERNDLVNFHSVDDAKHGLAALRAKGAKPAATVATTL